MEGIGGQLMNVPFANGQGHELTSANYASKNASNNKAIIFNNALPFAF
jgi:hypothetical protein